MKEDDDYEPPGQPEVLADIDFAEVCAPGPGDEVARPSWYRHEHGAELMHSQVCSSSQGCHSACGELKGLREVLHMLMRDLVSHGHTTGVWASASYKFSEV